jgi:hypothetical protein
MRNLKPIILNRVGSDTLRDIESQIRGQINSKLYSDVKSEMSARMFLDFMLFRARLVFIINMSTAPS